MNNSLYLFQSYQDAWDDYKRSLVSPSFPVWDYIILTASNAHQAESFQMQIENRCDFLPSRTVFAVIPDEGGVRVGSGGATLSALKYLSEQGGWEGKRVLVIHSGGGQQTGSAVFCTWEIVLSGSAYSARWTFVNPFR